MSTPILFGTSTSEKGYTTPKTIGLNSRSVGFGFGQRSVVNRGVVPPSNAPIPYPYYVGDNYGYFSGGYGASTYSADIDKVEISSDTITAFGSQDFAVSHSYGTFSAVDAYVLSGGNPALFPTQSLWQKYSYSSATSVSLPPMPSRLQDGYRGATNLSSTVNGYLDVSAKLSDTQEPVTIPNQAFIRTSRHAFASDAWALGGLIPALSESPGSQLKAHGFQSADFGYSAGGSILVGSALGRNSIRRFPYANDDNYTELVATLTVATQEATGFSETEAGYSLGGERPLSPSTIVAINTMERFPFASENESVVSISTTIPTLDHSGFNAGTHGYADTSSTGSGPTYITAIEKFSWGSSGQVSSVGSLGRNASSTGSSSQSS
jgi:hypothetical protein